VTYTLTCPRCGADFSGDQKERVADDVVQHASREHDHTLDCAHPESG
jgi:predicted small metal-binding protein